MKHADAISHKVNTFPAKILLQAVYLMFLNVQSPVFSSLFCCYVNAQSAVSIVQNLVLHALCNHRRWQTMLKAPAMIHTCVSHCRRADWQGSLLDRRKRRKYQDHHSDRHFHRRNDFGASGIVSAFTQNSCNAASHMVSNGVIADPFFQPGGRRHDEFKNRTRV